MHNSPEKNQDFRKAWDTTNTRWKAQQKAHDDQKIIDFYDQNLNLTLSQLAAITGKTVPELKSILMGAV
jgi:hypothetical protein